MYENILVFFSVIIILITNFESRIVLSTSIVLSLVRNPYFNIKVHRLTGLFYIKKLKSKIEIVISQSEKSANMYHKYFFNFRKYGTQTFTFYKSVLRTHTANCPLALVDGWRYDSFSLACLHSTFIFRSLEQILHGNRIKDLLRYKQICPSSAIRAFLR